MYLAIASMLEVVQDDDTSDLRLIRHLYDLIGSLQLFTTPRIVPRPSRYSVYNNARFSVEGIIGEFVSLFTRAPHDRILALSGQLFCI